MEYTLAATVSKGIHSSPHKVLGAIAWDALAAEALAAGQDAPGERGFGAVVTDHRSSWVRRAEITATSYHVKTYDYPRAADRWRGAGRNTWLAPSRAHREARALIWLLERGLGEVAPVAVAEWRTPRWLGRAGFLRRAVLVTRTWSGSAAGVVLPQLAPPQRTGLLDALAAHVDRLHAAGFRDGNLDLRNLLVRPGEDGSWQCTKIDSPRWHVSARPRDAAWRRDWDRLIPQLAAHAAPAWIAALRDRLSRG